MLKDITFKEYKKNSDIHGTVLYPAVMIAPVQKTILNELINKNEINSVFDPFHGSGTALYEAMEISQNIHLVGCDINPLANLITKVKLQGINSNVEFDIKKIKNDLEAPNFIHPYSFPNMNKWLREDIAESVRLIRSSIMKVDDNQNRLFFWYMLCDVLRRHSNTRSSTYKLHIKPEDVIERIENNVINSFLSSIEKNKKKFQKHSSNFILFKEDILEKIKEIDNKAFDISITSPPYGDNSTTVPYGQFSMIALHTIAEYDLELEGWELDNYSIIDSKSIGGLYSESQLSEYEEQLITPYLQKISFKKHKKVRKYFSDYFVFLNELCRVTNKYIVMTLGNRTVDRVQINLTEITKNYLEENNFPNEEILTREIPVKRMPKTTSTVYQRPVSSMNNEFTIIHRRYDQ